MTQHTKPVSSAQPKAPAPVRRRPGAAPAGTPGATAPTASGAGPSQVEISHALCEILLVGGTVTGCELLAAHLSAPESTVKSRITFAAGAAEAEAELARERDRPFDAVLVCAEAPGGIELVRQNAADRLWTAWIVWGDADIAVAIEAGASDIVGATPSREELLTALTKAICRSRVQSARNLAKARARRKREQRLRRTCDRLDSSRSQLMRQIRSLCETFTAACDSMASQIEHGALAAEFNTLARQELDIESLLRTTLEYVMPRVGPTNAAIFLPGSSGDYSVGAYVNYDGPRDAPEVLMEHLAAVVAPAMEQQDLVLLHREADGLEARLELGEGAIANWLGPCAVATMACGEDGECLAVLMFWRPQDRPFETELMPTLEVIRDLFGRQLARIVKSHNRHRPEDQWGENGGLDLAA